MHIRFDGKLVVVTGAGHGFGRCIAQTFSSLGATVHGCDLHAAELAQTAALGNIHTQVVDLTDRQAAAAMVMSRAVVPGMKRQGSGRIVNISSGAGLQASLTGIQAYCAAKHAVVGLTRQLAHEFGPFGITVHRVAPGFVLTNEATEKQWAAYGADGQQ